ncbi:MAG TPA: heme ABC transporter permease [Steroidobacteraceae bacterium]|nr:heme ABC transporter permease [Steroidobacteraceae bacterium]
MGTWTWFHKLASPPHFYRIAGKMIPWFAIPAALLIGFGIYGGLVRAPADYQQGDAFRIIYVHAPSAWLSLMCYSTMAISAAVGLIWRIKLSHALAAACAPIGASFTLLALATGSLWGKPMWGTFWTWDARLTSELILFFLYLGYMALRSAFDDLTRADRASAVLALVGIVNVPIIHFSVTWWNSLHQGSTVLARGGPKMPMSMLAPLLMCFLGFTLLFAALACVRVRGEVLIRERNATWLKELGSPQ